MADQSVAQLLLESAGHDLRASQALAAIADIHDTIVGFHAQQAVEKSLKAVLSHAGVAFRRTHDIAELLDVMADARLAPAPHSDRLDELQPYAVDARYGLVEPGRLDRTRILAMVAAVLDWASSLLAAPMRARR